MCSSVYPTHKDTFQSQEHETEAIPLCSREKEFLSSPQDREIELFLTDTNMSKKRDHCRPTISNRLTIKQKIYAAVVSIGIVVLGTAASLPFILNRQKASVLQSHTKNPFDGNNLSTRGNESVTTRNHFYLGFNSHVPSPASDLLIPLTSTTNSYAETITESGFNSSTVDHPLIWRDPEFNMTENYAYMIRAHGLDVHAPPSEPGSSHSRFLHGVDLGSIDRSNRPSLMDANPAQSSRGFTSPDTRLENHRAANTMRQSVSDILNIQVDGEGPTADRQTPRRHAQQGENYLQQYCDNIDTSAYMHRTTGAMLYYRDVVNQYQMRFSRLRNTRTRLQRATPGTRQYDRLQQQSRQQLYDLRSYQDGLRRGPWASDRRRPYRRLNDDDLDAEWFNTPNRVKRSSDAHKEYVDLIRAGGTSLNESLALADTLTQLGDLMQQTTDLVDILGDSVPDKNQKQSASGKKGKKNCKEKKEKNKKKNKKKQTSRNSPSDQKPPNNNPSNQRPPNNSPSQVSNPIDFNLIFQSIGALLSGIMATLATIFSSCDRDDNDNPNDYPSPNPIEPKMYIEFGKGTFILANFNSKNSTPDFNATNTTEEIFSQPITTELIANDSYVPTLSELPSHITEPTPVTNQLNTTYEITPELSDNNLTLPTNQTDIPNSTDPIKPITIADQLNITYEITPELSDNNLTLPANQTDIPNSTDSIKPITITDQLNITYEITPELSDNNLTLPANQTDIPNSTDSIKPITITDQLNITYEITPELSDNNLTLPANQTDIPNSTDSIKPITITDQLNITYEITPELSDNNLTLPANQTDIPNSTDSIKPITITDQLNITYEITSVMPDDNLTFPTFLTNTPNNNTSADQNLPTPLLDIPNNNTTDSEYNIPDTMNTFVHWMTSVADFFLDSINSEYGCANVLGTNGRVVVYPSLSISNLTESITMNWEYFFLNNQKALIPLTKDIAELATENISIPMASPKIARNFVHEAELFRIMPSYKQPVTAGKSIENGKWLCFYGVSPGFYQLSSPQGEIITSFLVPGHTPPESKNPSTPPPSDEETIQQKLEHAFNSTGQDPSLLPVLNFFKENTHLRLIDYSDGLDGTYSPLQIVTLAANNIYAEDLLEFSEVITTIAGYFSLDPRLLTEKTIFWCFTLPAIPQEKSIQHIAKQINDNSKKTSPPSDSKKQEKLKKLKQKQQLANAPNRIIKPHSTVSSNGDTNFQRPLAHDESTLPWHQSEDSLSPEKTQGKLKTIKQKQSQLNAPNRILKPNSTAFP
ncbi:hypothetical protein CI610_03023 [invertebrate metagenome]|uniref:Uncharacterized protein n=1 Tax=invertebrate metagenome TaxID=1711999 RepID=A0A2H9T4B2_9ZZZZ